MSLFTDGPTFDGPDHEVLLIAGSRAEAARLAPIARAMITRARMHAVTVAAGADPMSVLDAFESLGVDADVTVLPGEPLRTLAAEAASLTTRLDGLIADRDPSAVLISGGSGTSAATAQVAFWRKVPVVHLQTGTAGDDLLSPFPQEANRRVISQLASLFLLTGGSAGLGTPLGPNAIVIGDPLAANSPPADPALAGAVWRARSGRRLVTVAMTGDEALRRAAADLAADQPELEVALVGIDLGFSDLLALLSASTLLLTDDVPLSRDTIGIGALTLLVDRHAEFSDAASAAVVPEPRQIVRAALRLLDGAGDRPVAPAGAGLAAQRAEEAMAWMFGLQPTPPTLRPDAPGAVEPATGS